MQHEFMLEFNISLVYTELRLCANEASMLCKNHADVQDITVCEILYITDKTDDTK